VTISTNDQKVDKSKFDESFDNIFGVKPVSRGSYVQRDGKLVEKTLETSERVNGPMVMKGHEDFVSPIDGKVITSRRQLAAHNKEHGVTNSSDYSSGYIADKARARNAAGKKYLTETRRTDINEAIQRHT
jgi:hypothetical protein